MTKARNKRSLTIARHRTSVSLEAPFWEALAELAQDQRKSIAGLISEIDRERTSRGDGTSLSASLRLYVLERMKNARTKS